MYKNLAATFVAACFFSPAFSQTPPAKGRTAEPVKAGFVYVSPITEAGWTRQHDEGRKAVEAALGNQVKTTFVENVAEGADAERVIRDLADVHEGDGQPVLIHLGGRDLARHQAAEDTLAGGRCVNKHGHGLGLRTVAKGMVVPLT